MYWLRMAASAEASILAAAGMTLATPCSASFGLDPFDQLAAGEGVELDAAMQEKTDPLRRGAGFLQAGRDLGADRDGIGEDSLRLPCA